MPRDPNRLEFSYRYPSGKELLAHARQAIREVVERHAGTWEGPGTTADLVQRLQDLDEAIGSWFHRKRTGWKAQMPRGRAKWKNAR